MKRSLSLILAAALALSLLAGCTPNTASNGSGPSTPDPTVSGSDQPDVSRPTPEGRPEVSLMVLSGPTGVGAAKLLHDNELDASNNHYSVTVATDNTEVTTALTNLDADIAAIATNAAAMLYAQSGGAVQVLAVNTLGVLYILEKGDTVHSIADLAGKTLYCPSNTKGANPEHILNHLLSKTNMDQAAVNIEWLTPQEITAKITSSDAGICMLPVPAATALMVQDSGVRQAVSLSEAWQDVEDAPLPMGCVVVRTAFAEEHPQAVEAFLEEYRQSIAYMSDPANLTDAAALVAEFGIAPNAKVAEKAIPQCSLTFLTGQEMRKVLESYYEILFQAEPKSIGGGLPYDSFYYGLG